MPPAGVSMLQFLATVFLAVDKYTGRMHAPCRGLHVTVPCDRVRPVTKFRILHKRFNMPSGDKHVSVPCDRLRSVTKISHIAQKV